MVSLRFIQSAAAWRSGCHSVWLLHCCPAILGASAPSRDRPRQPQQCTSHQHQSPMGVLLQLGAVLLTLSGSSTSALCVICAGSWYCRCSASHSVLSSFRCLCFSLFSFHFLFTLCFAVQGHGTTFVRSVALSQDCKKVASGDDSGVAKWVSILWRACKLDFLNPVT